MSAFLLFLTIFIQSTNGAEPELVPATEQFDISYKINSRFYSGSALIYDCSRGYFTCVNGDGLETCKTARESSEYRGEFLLNCAPLRVFKTRLECLKENYRVLQSAGAKRFCYPK